MALAAVLVLGLRPWPASPSRPILISSGSWAPYVGPDLPQGGPLAELVTECLRRARYSPEVSYTSWSLAEDRVRTEASVGVFPLVSSQARRAEFLASEPLLEFKYVLFFDRRRGTPNITSPSDLTVLRVGGIAGYDYWSELEAAVGDFVEFESAMDGFRALANGEIDVLAEGLVSGQAVIVDPDFTGDAADFDYVRGDGPLVQSVENLYFMTANTAAASKIMNEFNRELAELRRTGDYERIVAPLRPSTAEEVELLPSESSGLVELLDSTGKVVLLAPRGTRARVIAWPDEFVAPSNAQSGPLLLQVKVTNGAARGRAMYVDARSVQLEAGDR